MPKDFELEEKPKVIFIELVDQQDSGFIQEDTQGLPTQVQLRAPTVRFIPNEGRRRGVKVDDKGKKIYYNEAIRYIKNETIISKDEQKRLGIEPSPEKREDLIPIEKGYATIVREGAAVGLFDYIMDVFYNEDNHLKHPNKATKIFRVLEVDKQAEEINEQEMIAADALTYIATLYDKLGKNQYKYKEDKINAICELFAIVAETMPTKTYAIIQFAKKFPREFLVKVQKLEQTAITEVIHGLELSVIRFEKNMAEYVSKDKVIKSLGTGTYSKDKQIEMLADYFRTPDGNTAYTEFRAELEAAKEKALKN